MEDTSLSERRAELEAIADGRGIDLKSLKGLPDDDDGLMVAALASVLELDLVGAFDVQTGVAQLERQSRRLQLEQEIRDDLRQVRSTTKGAGPTPEGNDG